METAQAKMFVRSLTTSSAKIIMAFMLARTVLDVKELREWTGMKRQTIYDALDDLQALGKVEKQTLAHGRHVWLPASDLLPGFRQMSPKRTSEPPDVQKSDTTTLLGGGDSINLINTDSLNSINFQMSVLGTSGILPDVLDILRHTDLLFDGSLVMSRDLADREPLDVLAWCAYAFREKSKIKGAGGVVRNRLMDNEPAPEWARQQWRETLPGDFLEALGLAEYTCEICEAKFKKMADLGAHRATHPQRFPCAHCERVFDVQIDLDAHYAQEHTPKVIQADESITVPIHGAMNAERAWQSVLGQLQMEMPRASFETWVRDTQAVRYGGNTLSIGVRNAYARDWLESRLLSTVERLLVGILNQSVAVEFVVSDL